MSNSAGIVTKVSGESYVISGENTTPLAVGSSFSAADILVTKVGANLEVKFHDDSLVSLGPSSRIEVKEFIFDANKEVEPSFVVHMFEGVVRSVSGKVVEQNPDAFKLSSPLATIGIRGTETLHIISPANEMHAVVSLGAGHTVVMGTPDGRAIVISDSLQGLKLATNDFSPLQIINTSPELLDEFIQKIQSEGSVQANPQGVFVFADAEFLNSIANVNLITGSVGFLAIEQLGNLVTVLDVENSIAADLVSDVFTGDTLLLSSLEPRATSITAEQVVPDPITPDPIVPDPIVPDPIVPDPIVPGPVVPPPDPAGHVITQANLMGTLHAGSTGNMATNGANDTITISGAMQNAGTILSGDAGGNISGAAVFGGNDSITISNLTGGYVYGDASGGITQGAHGGNDTIVINNMSTSSAPSAVFGDAFSLQDASVGGNDSITTTTLTNGLVLGDAFYLYNTSHGGNDYISIGSMSGGKVSGDAAYMHNSSVGGNDSIVITTMNGGKVYGDASGDASGDVDTMNHSSHGGDDNISVATMISGLVLGDAHDLRQSSHGGDDNISISIMVTGTVSGDASYLYNTNHGGNDYISIGSMATGTIYGDALQMDQTSVGGNDTITIGSMAGGTIHGDAQTMSGNATGGNDSITIGSIATGTIYGNSGNDTITITSAWTSSSNSVNLYGGAGDDTFIFNGVGNNSTITIKDFGQGAVGTNFDHLGFGSSMSLTGQTVVGSDLHLTATSGGNTLTVVLENITSLQAGQLIPGV